MLDGHYYTLLTINNHSALLVYACYCWSLLGMKWSLLMITKTSQPNCSTLLFSAVEIDLIKSGYHNPLCLPKAPPNLLPALYCGCLSKRVCVWKGVGWYGGRELLLYGIFIWCGHEPLKERLIEGN